MGFLGLFPNGDSDNDIVDDIQLEFIRREIQDIIDLLNSGSVVTKSIIDSSAIISMLKPYLAKTSQDTITVLAGKILSGTQVITQKIDVTENRIVAKIGLLNGNLSSEINNSLNKLAANLGFIQSSLLNSIKQQTNDISNSINNQTIKLGNAIGLTEQRITNRINNLSTDIIQASQLEIAADVKIANRYVDLLNELFGDIAKDLAIEFSKEFKHNDDYTPKELTDYILPQLEDRLKDALIDSFKSSAFKDAIHPKTNTFLNFIDSIFNGVNAVSSITDSLVNVGGEVSNTLSQALNIIGVDDVLRMFIQFTIEPYLRHVYNLSSKGARSDLLNVEQVLSLYLYDMAYSGKAKEILQYHGITDEDIKHLFEMTEKPLSESEIQSLYYRGEIEQGDLIRRLWKIGITDDTIKQRMELWKIIPPINDIIRMANRDVFSQNIIDEFGLYEDIPQEYLDWARKAGLSEYWSQKYYAANWIMPSPNQGFEMFQRGIIDETQLNLLLKSLDIVPKWRDYLVQLNYNTITRVDVRRMHDMGFLTDDETRKRYRDVGYSPSDAQLMLEWTKAYNSDGGETGRDSTRQLTISMIIRGYKNNLLTETEAISRLMNLGYSQENASYILELETVNRNVDAISDKLKDNVRRIETVISKGYINGLLSENDAINRFIEIGFSTVEAQAEISYLDLELSIAVDETIINYTKTQYIQYQITGNEVQEILRVHGFPDNEINRQISLWNIDRLNRHKLPSKTEIEKFFSKGLIDVGQAQNFLRGLAYPDETILLYLREWTS